MTAIDVQQRLDRLLGLCPREIDLSLGRLNRLLARLGNPQNSLPPVVHVAGTNGKGSCVAMMSSVLRQAGLCVHVYTSPHLVRFNERISLCGNYVSDAQLIQALDFVEAQNAGEEITFFEITTAAAFYLFRTIPADYVLLEVGLGGRLDATNVIDAPVLSVITPIAMDHQDFLGDTLLGIAGEKAGIIKANGRVVSASQTPEVEQLLIDTSRDRNAQIWFAGRDWKVSCDAEGKLSYDDSSSNAHQSGDRQNKGVYGKLALRGPHQLANAGLAIASLRALQDERIDTSVIARGLETVKWPARMQSLQIDGFDFGDRGSLKLPVGSEIWLDGAHNPHAARALAAAIAQLAISKPMPTILITAILSNKDAVRVYSSLAPVFSRVYATSIRDTKSALSSEELSATLDELIVPHDTTADFIEALLKISHSGEQLTGRPSAIDGEQPMGRPSLGEQPAIQPPASEKPVRIVIAGSLYLAGEVLSCYSDN